MIKKNHNRVVTNELNCKNKSELAIIKVEG